MATTRSYSGIQNNVPLSTLVATINLGVWILACDEPFGLELRVERLSRVEFGLVDSLRSVYS